jgi:predicted RNA-binding protein with PIN domain
LVDGTNVVGSRPDGWWRDRHAAFARLVVRLKRLAEHGDEVTVVFDGAAVDPLQEGDHGGVHVRWARRRGRDAADDRIVELVEVDGDPSGLRVVTSDRALAGRAQAAGAVVDGAGSLLRRLDELDARGPG